MTRSGNARGNGASGGRSAADMQHHDKKDTVRETIVESLEAPRLSGMDRKKFSQFREKRKEYERLVDEYNTQDGHEALVSASDIGSVSEDEQKECIEKEVDVSPEDYDLIEIEKDISHFRMPKKKNSLKTRVRTLSLNYGKRLNDMGYLRFISECGRIAVKHILPRIDHDQLYERARRLLELHKEQLKGNFNKFMQKLIVEADVIDRAEMSARTRKRSNNHEESDNESGDKRGNRMKGDEGKKWDRDAKKKGRRKRKSPDDGAASTKREKPDCLNPDCDGQQFLDKRLMTTPEERKKLLDDYRKKKTKPAGSKSNAVVGKEDVSRYNSALFSSTFCGGRVKASLLADQGSDDSILSLDM